MNGTRESALHTENSDRLWRGEKREKDKKGTDRDRGGQRRLARRDQRLCRCR